LLLALQFQQAPGATAIRANFAVSQASCFRPLMSYRKLRPQCVENFQDRQIQRPLENFRLLRLCVTSFGYAKEDTLLPL
jgi:hypothetical protein